MRIVFARSPEANGKVEQTRSAKVAAITAFDMKFYEHADVPAPAMDNLECMASLLEAALETTALRNAFL